jgi:hypothetical protein
MIVRDCPAATSRAVRFDLVAALVCRRTGRLGADVRGATAIERTRQPQLARIYRSTAVHAAVRY